MWLQVHCVVALLTAWAGTGSMKFSVRKMLTGDYIVVAACWL